MHQARVCYSRLGRIIMGSHVEPNTPLDIELQQRRAGRRAAAVELIAKTKPLSTFPIWFALVMLALVAALTLKTRINQVPYLEGLLISTIGWITGCIIRIQRRIEALVQLVVQSD